MLVCRAKTSILGVANHDQVYAERLALCLTGFPWTLQSCQDAQSVTTPVMLSLANYTKMKLAVLRNTQGLLGRLA